MSIFPFDSKSLLECIVRSSIIRVTNRLESTIPKNPFEKPRSPPRNRNFSISIVQKSPLESSYKFSSCTEKFPSSQPRHSLYISPSNMLGGNICHWMQSATRIKARKFSKNALTEMIHERVYFRGRNEPRDHIKISTFPSGIMKRP